jgi:hypothetical protein
VLARDKGRGVNVGVIQCEEMRAHSKPPLVYADSSLSRINAAAGLSHLHPAGESAQAV